MILGCINMREKKHLIGSYEKAFPENTTLADMLWLSADAGYDFFEMSIDRTDNRINRLYDEGFQTELKQLILNAPINIGSICLSALSTYTLGNINPDIREKAKDIFCKAILLAARFGVRIVQIPACDMPKFDERSNDTNTFFLDSLKELIPFAAMHGVIVGLENMENDYADSVKKCMCIINEINSPYFQLYVDAGNITSAALLSGEDIKDDMYSGLGRYCAFHQKETRPQKYGGLFYGEGHVDFQRCTQYALDMGAYRFVMEYWYTGNPDWKSDLKKARELCEKWIVKCLNSK